MLVRMDPLYSVGIENQVNEGNLGRQSFRIINRETFGFICQAGSNSVNGSDGADLFVPGVSILVISTIQ